MSALSKIEEKQVNCAQEPIHIPQSIQPHGMLFAVTRQNLLVCAASENLAAALQATPQALIGRRIDEILKDPGSSRLSALLRTDPRDGRVSVRLKFRELPAKWDAWFHRSGHLIVVELEPRSPDAEDKLLFGRVRRGIERIRRSASMTDASATLAEEIRALSRHERAMVYRFDADWNGEVIAEDRIEAVDSYLGHSFPASDIPTQARALYLRNTLRLIPDARYMPSPIHPGLDPVTGARIDLSDSILRSVSPTHCEYLGNMGVVGSMSVSIVKDGALWGLVACHHRDPRFVSNTARQGCELLVQAFAWYLENAERRSVGRALELVRQQGAQALLASSEDRDCRMALAAIAPILLELTGTTGLALVQPSSVWTHGGTPGIEQIRGIVDWLSPGPEQSHFSDRLAELLPAAARCAREASGIAATRLPQGWLLWFRPEWSHARRWAGDPTELSLQAATGKINPRRSFRTWTRDVRGRSRPWEGAERAAVLELGRLTTRLLFEDQEIARRALERRTNLQLSERATELERLSRTLQDEILERKAAQAELQHNRDSLELEVAARSSALVVTETRLSSAIETLPEAFALFDAEDRLVVCNEAYRDLYEVNRLHAKPGITFEALARFASQNSELATEGFDPELWLKERMAQRRAIDNQPSRSERRGPQGQWLEVHDRRTRDGGIVTLIVDVTETRGRLAALAERDKLTALGQLASGVAHEINNLLQPALVFPDMVSETLPPEDTESREFLDQVTDSARKVRDIVRSILLYARKEEVSLQVADLALETGNALKFLKGVLPPGIALRQELGIEPCNAAFNKTELTQVLSNLVLNGAHAMGGKGTIGVDLGTARPSDAAARELGLEPSTIYATLRVVDQGSGMDEATLSHIFEPFFTTKPAGEGTGLGLSVVFGILRSWQGAIAVASTPGVGTTFTLYIPMAEAHPPADGGERSPH